MSADGDSLANRVQDSYLQLSGVAADLNAISDELGKSVAEIDAALKRLNLGIIVWVPIRKWHGDQLDFFTQEIGYAKIEGKWGIALRTVSGSDINPEDALIEAWLFSDAPRQLRLDSIDILPDLLKHLSDEATKMSSKVMNKLGVVKQVAAAVKSAADAPAKASAPTPTGIVITQMGSPESPKPIARRISNVIPPKKPTDVVQK